jgi:GTP pyrophosphokinase
MTSRPPLSSLFEEALLFAFDLHRHQKRKGNSSPYISHLLAVCGLVLDYGGDEEEAIAALLHDAIEDQGGAPTRDEIGRRFGARVAAIVDGCSDTDQHPKPPWRERKEAYLAHLPDAERSVRLVSAADKLHNALTILRDYRRSGEDLWGRFRGGREGTLWYYRSLVGVLSQTGPAHLAEDLAAVVDELERLSRAAGERRNAT